VSEPAIAPADIEVLFDAEVALRTAAVNYGEAKVTKNARELRAAAREYARIAKLFESALDDATARSGGRAP
jgi:hypothetical protein